MTRDAIPDWYFEAPKPAEDKMGFELLELSADRIVGSIPVAGNEQPFGLLHGGASAWLVESLASLGAVAHGQPDRIPVGVDLNITHLRAVRTGRVTGVATALHLGGRIACYQVELRDDENRLTATGRLTCQLLPA